MTTHIVVLTGAGISADSGVSTFRDKDGIWSKVRIEDVATPEAFARDPDRVQAFYNMRRRLHQGVKPNAAHFALARLEAQPGVELRVVTQNVDCLHEMAGTRNLIHMHGEMLKAWCLSCDGKMPWTADIASASQCSVCGSIGRLRPDVVWFGEMPYHMETISEILARADVFVSIGTSGNVYPAASFVAVARQSGAKTVELNLEPSAGVSQFDEAVHGRAVDIVPAFVDKILAKGA